jgi:hypothetical protein
VRLHHELAIDDASGAQRCEAVGATVPVCAHFTIEPRERPRLAEQPHLQWPVAQLVGARDGMPAACERGRDVVENRVVDGDILVAMSDERGFGRPLFTGSQRPPR